VKAIITIPCYNEGKRLKISTFEQFLKLHENIDFVFVNDGSTDNTLSWLDKLKRQNPDRILLLSYHANKGKAEAVRQGVLLSISFRPDFVGFWDADLATPLSAILDFLRVCDRRSEIEWVFGARVKLLGRNIKRKEIRHYCGRFFATLTSIILNLPVYDTQCGAKLFRNSARLEQIFHEQFTSRWIFDVEIIARLIASAGNMTTQRIIFEYPLYEWVDVHDSKLRYSDFFIAIHELFKVWLYLKNTPR
jgi:glycosyltransferase involved in cell wall biosynthesis